MARPTRGTCVAKRGTGKIEDGIVVCPSCGATIAADGLFCSKCGLPRPESGAAPVTPPPEESHTPVPPPTEAATPAVATAPSWAQAMPAKLFVLSWLGKRPDVALAMLGVAVFLAGVLVADVLAGSREGGVYRLGLVLVALALAVWLWIGVRWGWHWGRRRTRAYSVLAAGPFGVLAAIFLLAAIVYAGESVGLVPIPSERPNQNPQIVAEATASALATTTQTPLSTPAASVPSPSTRAAVSTETTEVASPSPAASADPDDETSASPGASFAPDATGIVATTGGGTPADRLPGEPDPNLTPGALNPAVTPTTINTTICVSGWTATIRPSSSYTTALKIQQITQYGYSDTSTSSYEEDHLIPLELGGAPADLRNLWPEPYTISLADGRPTGAHTKDGFETKLKNEVCAGTISLAQAQTEIGDHWVHAYYGIAFALPSATLPPVPVATAAPTVAPTAAPPVAPTAAPTDPYAAAKAAGATAVCADGSLSFSPTRQGTCSGHGGVHWWTGNVGAEGPGDH
jgi:hypothetical protein